MIFLIVLGCHIPFLFFAGKEAVLIIVDEFNRQSISKALGDKLTGMRSYDLAHELGGLSPSRLHIAESDDEIDNDGAPAQRKTLAYKQMPYYIYFISTTALYAAEIIGAIIIQNIGTIFEFVSAICSCNMAFFLPAAFYLMAEHKYSTILERRANKGYRRLSIAFLLMGTAAFMLLISVAFADSLDPK